MISDKLVSIYIPTHFRPELLDRAISSVFNQTHKSVEVVVCIDGYCLDTLAVIKKWVNKGSNLKYHCEINPQGACFCRNKAISMCTGEYITGLDDDDYFEPNRIEEFINVFFDENEILYTNYKIKAKSNKLAISPAINVKDKIYEFNYIGNQVFFHQNIAKDVVFDESMPAWQDYETWLSLFDKGYRFKLLDVPSYIVDLSHPHERITKNATKVLLAYHLMLQKHKKFNMEPELSCLKYSLYRYSNIKMSYKDAFNILRYKNFFFLIRLIIRRIVK